MNLRRAMRALIIATALAAHVACGGSSSSSPTPTPPALPTATFTVTTLTQKLDGAAAGILAESFNSRFAACSGLSFTPGMILANGAACATVGACTASTYSTYQFSLAGTDANGHTITFDSPVLQLGAR